MATGTKTATEKAKVTAGDVGGGGGDTAIAATATTMAVMVAELIDDKLPTYLIDDKPPTYLMIPL